MKPWISQFSLRERKNFCLSTTSLIFSAELHAEVKISANLGCMCPCAKSNIALLVTKENLETKPREKMKSKARRCYNSLFFFFPLLLFSLLSPGQLNSESDAIQGRLWRWHICKCSNATRRYKGRITLGITFL